MKNQRFETRAGGFCFYRCGFNRQANVKLTPMPHTLPLLLPSIE
jgi:hypothetical protein